MLRPLPHRPVAGLALVGLLPLAACGDGAPGPADTAAVACDGTPLAPRQLRLLTRAEYAATVVDLLGGAASGSAGGSDGGSACADDVDCELATQSCTADVCTDDPCTTATFVLGGYGSASSVVVAGSFNGWASTAEAGGLALVHVGDADLWYAKAALGEGAYTYKLVVDGQWMTDPTNPDTVDDGYGGSNSVVTLSCDGDATPTPGLAAEVAALVADFPVESRPEGFPFDNAASAGLVSPTHADRYLDAADTLAGLVLADPDAFLGCDADDDACVDTFLATFGARAFRRPLTTDEQGRYRALVDAGSDREEGLHTAVAALLSSPWFLYRTEVGAPVAGGAWQLGGYETASSLSYFLWGTMPDAELFRAAAAGELADADQREAQARRLLADPRARAQVERFAVMWLGVESVPDLPRNAELYPGFDAELGASMVEETATFFGAVVFDGPGTLTELYSARYSYVDAELAALYGVSGPTGATPTRVDLPGERAGILSQAAILTAYAHSDQTSPVRRGVFVRERLLCHDLPPPPPNAGSVPTVEPDATTRERYEQHADDPFCDACHKSIDPIGFGLEHYDAIGAWRDADQGEPVDASGDLPDAERIGAETHAAFTDAPELGVLLASTDSASACLVKQVVRFARGYQEPDDEACAVEDLRAAFVQSGGDVPELLVAVARSSTFVGRE